MSAYEKSPSKGKAPSLQGGLGASRAVIQAILSLAAKHRRTQWPAFPMGQRTKGTFKSASSYLLQQLMHRSRSPDAEVEAHHQNEEESEESEESETMNLEVCLLPLPPASSPHSRAPSSCQAWLPQLQVASALVSQAQPTPSRQAPLPQTARAFLCCSFLFSYFLCFSPPVRGRGWGGVGVSLTPPNTYFLFMVSYVSDYTWPLWKKKCMKVMDSMLSKLTLDKVTSLVSRSKSWFLISPACLSKLKYFCVLPSCGLITLFSPE